MAAPKPEIALIAAVARNGVIGDGNRLLWRLPEDMRYLREQTSGHPVIMGRKTWDSLPERFRPLPGRTNIVVTRQRGWSASGAVVVHGLDEAIAAAGAVPRLFVIGGSELYAAALPIADELLLTELDADFDGDVHFPPWDRAQFTETARALHHAAPPNAFDFAFVRYRRRTSPSVG
ncbi:dihydrofolate reductase [Aquincola sp. S2]|uniref:Dihydrofolate reductase n=1 Tax=Pseudaquabacterium terrae TaxID=2732868 RepID=A0ABX2EIC8_9BURK|nr:dihydrofolate reductase [Aquabacterium terrae]NRF68369.1 dihydrofolate reductase [Aquabacterium terrae]